MNSTARIPGTTETITASSALIIAPHFDDEVLGCGGLLVQLARRGAVARVLFLSDGGGGVEAVSERAAYARRRREEAECAAEVLGVAGFECLGLPDGALAARRDVIAEALRRSLLTFRPRLLLAPSPFELTADHRAAFDALFDVLSPVRGGDDLAGVTAHLEVLLYEVNHPGHPDVLVDVSDAVETIARAMACYESQEERHPYLEAALGLRRYRALTLTPGPRAVEAYRRLDASAFQLMGREELARSLVPVPRAPDVDGPLISVIVRTKDRPHLLAEALQSIAGSTYRSLEVVLVNDGGGAVQPPANFWPSMVRVDLEPGRGRAAAANAGLNAATGQYVAFLDDDDLVEPDHFEVLAGLVRSSGVRVAYTDAVVGVWELGESGWDRVERRLPYSRDFDPDLLLFDNYIPLNTLLVERTLARQAGPWDESFHVFEDWDWLIRLAALGPFHHHRRVTCEYRHFRAASHHALGGTARQRDDFLAMKARVLGKHAAGRDPQQLSRVVDRLRAESVAAIEEATHRATEGRAERAAREGWEAQYHRLNGEAVAMRGHVDVLIADGVSLREGQARLEAEKTELEAEKAELLGDRETLRAEAVALRREIESRDGELRRLYGDEQALRATVEDQNAHLGRLYAEIERLLAVVREMEATRAWRVRSWWLRRSGTGVSGGSGGPSGAGAS